MQGGRLYIAERNGTRKKLQTQFSPRRSARRVLKLFSRGVVVRGGKLILPAASFGATFTELALTVDEIEPAGLC